LIDKAQAGVFAVFLRLAQPIVFLANAAWSVIFAHVANWWESGDREMAMSRLETAYKGVCLATMSLTVLIYVSAGLWVRILPGDYRAGQAVLGGLLMFFQVICNLSLTTIVAKLRERPIVIVLCALAGGVLNVVLARWWMSAAAAGGAPAAAAWAAGVGMYAGAGAVTVVYFLVARISVSPGTWFVLASPAILLLPAWIVAPAWAGVLAAAAMTGLILRPDQKRLLLDGAGRIGRLLKGPPS